MLFLAFFTCLWFWSNAVFLYYAFSNPTKKFLFPIALPKKGQSRIWQLFSCSWIAKFMVCILTLLERKSKIRKCNALFSLTESKFLPKESSFKLNWHKFDYLRINQCDWQTFSISANFISNGMNLFGNLRRKTPTTSASSGILATSPTSSSSPSSTTSGAYWYVNRVKINFTFKL